MSATKPNMGKPSTGTPNTTKRDQDQSIVWNAPDADVWELEAAHGSGLWPVLLRPQFEEAFAQGFRRSFATLGMPLSHVELRHVNGWPYVSFFMHDAPRKAGSPPPNFVLKAITRIHPGFRRRTKIARAAIAERRPQAFATDWFAERDQWVDRIVAFQRDDLASLTDQQLAGHTRAVAELAVEGLQRHFELLSGAIPVGEWLHRSMQWGFDPADARRAVMHSTPVHTEAAERVQRIADAMGDAAFSDFDDIHRHSTEASDALDHYLTHHGWWATEDMFTARPVRAFPESIIANVRCRSQQIKSTDSASELITTLRAQVPDDDRVEFDRLAQDAHHSYQMLDDNSGILGSWVAGVTGHVLRHVSQRLAAQAHIHEPDHLWALGIDDVIGLLEQRGPVTADEAAVRYDQWRQLATLTPPPHLNGPPSPPPDPSIFPRPVSQLVTGMTTFLADKFNYGAEAVGIGSETVRGRAVVAADASDAIDRIQPGDILVTGATTPAYNAILPLVAGIVVTAGGPSCHAAVMARELHIPAIVGYVDALTSILDGAIIELDPVKASVHAL